MITTCTCWVPRGVPHHQVAGKHGKLRPALSIPHTSRAVHTGRDDACSIGAPGRVVHPAAVAGEGHQRYCPMRVPDTGSVIGAGRDNPRFVRIPRRVVHFGTRTMTQDQPLIARSGIPNSDRAVRARGEDARTIRVPDCVL